MLYRKKLSIGGIPLRLGGQAIGVPPWRSADSDGGANPQAWFTSRITNGFFNGYDPHRVGQKASETNPGSGRATTYMDTGYADVSVEGVFEGNVGLSALPCVRVTPDSWEHNLSAFPEVWLSPELGIGPWVVWYIAAPSIQQTIPCWGPGQELAPGTPRNVRVEVIGRRLKAFDRGVFKMEFIVPPHMEHSTKHGVTHDVTMKYRPDGSGGWEEMPNYGETEGMAESSWSFKPITHFSDEPVGLLGEELIANESFLTATDWITSTGWSLDTTTDDALSLRPAALVSLPDAGSPFDSGYLSQTLDTPLEVGKTYRLTVGAFPVDLTPPVDIGFGTVQAEVFISGGAVKIFTVTPTNSQYYCGAQTFDFVADAAYTGVRMKVIAMEDVNSVGTYKLRRKINYTSLKEFTAL